MAMHRWQGGKEVLKEMRDAEGVGHGRKVLCGIVGDLGGGSSDSVNDDVGDGFAVAVRPT